MLSSTQYGLIAVITLTDQISDAAAQLRECVLHGVEAAFIRHPQADEQLAEAAARKLAKDFPFFPVGIPRDGSAIEVLARDVECGFSLTWCLFVSRDLEMVEQELRQADKKRSTVLKENRHHLMFASILCPWQPPQGFPFGHKLPICRHWKMLTTPGKTPSDINVSKVFSIKHLYGATDVAVYADHDSERVEAFTGYVGYHLVPANGKIIADLVRLTNQVSGRRLRQISRYPPPV
jgi:hypothetical protein